MARGLGWPGDLDGHPNPISTPIPYPPQCRGHPNLLAISGGPGIGVDMGLGWIWDWGGYGIGMARELGWPEHCSGYRIGVARELG